jgi:chemotaxis protein histidine kinase CheA
MAAKNDSIFQLSLTEIAFTICFLLMLLLGLMIFKTTQDHKQLKETVARMDGAAENLATLDAVQEAFEKQLHEMGAQSPSDLISKLAKDATAQQESDRLKVILEQKEQQITAMAQVELLLKDIAEQKKIPAAKEHVEQAIILLETLKQAMAASEQRVAASGQPGKAGDQAKQQNSASDKSSPSPGLAGLSPHVSATTADAVKDKFDELLAIEEQLRALSADTEQHENPQATLDTLFDQSAAYQQMMQSNDRPQVLRKDNTDLRGQIVFLQNKLDAKGGMDFPPCWADEKTGKIQMLFTLVLKDAELSIAPAWPAVRNEDAKAIPNMALLLSKPHSSYSNFMAAVRPIYDLSRVQQCRHYVRLASAINDAVLSDRRRLLIENVFYKFEVRR